MTPRLLKGLRRATWTVAGQLLIALPASGAPTAAEKAAAEALFQEATELVAAGNLTQACEKFEASNAIEPGLGVKLWLADCYDRAGRTASAWGLFSEAAALAQQSGQTERERAANQRASELEKRLSRLELKLPAEGLPNGLVVTLDGATIPEASLGSALPIDPGTHTVGLKAPGYKPIELSAEVAPGPATVSLDVPQLEREPARPKPTAQPGAMPVVAPARPGTTQRTLGWTLGGLGVLSFAGAGFLAYRAHDLDSASRDHCLTEEPNACDAEGARLRDQARTFGNAATAATIAGAALTATGVVLLLTAPKSSEGRSLAIGTRVTPTSSALILTGRL
jgi:serine/threonine-protein kinase